MMDHKNAVSLHCALISILLSSIDFEEELVEMCELRYLFVQMVGPDL